MVKKLPHPIKVCMVVNQIYHIDTRVISYTEALVGAGAQVHVISAQQSPEDSKNPKPNITIYPIPLSRNYSNGLGYVINYLFSIILFTIYTAFLYLRYKYDVIHIHNMPDTLVLAALLPKMFGAKVILDIHDPMPNMFMSKFGKGADSTLVKFLKFQERLSARLADEVITANPLFKEELSTRRIPAEKITVINNIPSPKIFNRRSAPKAAGHPAEKFTLIYPGTIAPRYSLDVAIRALPELKRKIPHIYLKIIGEKSQHASELIKLASKLEVSDVVDFVGYLPASQIAGEITKADIGIYTAIPNAHMDIAMPGKVLEYVMMGVPVVASRLRILETFFNDNSMLFFTPGSVEEFASQVLRLYSDKSLRYNLIKNADAVFTHKYTWENEFVNYMAMIDKLTTGSN